MRNSNEKSVVVKGPSKGLVTVVPPDLDDSKRQFLTVAQNVRAEFEQLKSAPGAERIDLTDGILETPANLIHQPDILGTDPDAKKSPIIGNSGSLFVMARRSAALTCPKDDCAVTFVVVGNTGKEGANLEKLALQIITDDPDFIIHTGNMVGPSSGVGAGENPYEELVGKYFNSWLGRYRGIYGTGPLTNAFFPVLGEYDHTEGPTYRYIDFFKLPAPETRYEVKRGPVHFMMLNSYGSGPAAQTGPGGAAVSGTGSDPGIGEDDLSTAGDQYQWLATAAGTSDCTWRFVVMNHPPKTSGTDTLYSPGYSAVAYDFQSLGIDGVFCGLSRSYERAVSGDLDIPIINVGLGGMTIDSSFSGSTTGFRYNTTPGYLRCTATQTTMFCEFVDYDGNVVDSFTLDPQRVPGTCYLADNAATVTSLDVIPDSVELEVGQSFGFKAIARYSDGSTDDVTNLSLWESSDLEIVTMGDPGNATGASAGTATVTATYSGQSDTSEVTVTVKCLDEPIDIALVLDRSGSMGGVSGTVSRIQRLKEAVNLFLNSMDIQATESESDRAAVISFSGDFRMQTADVRIDAYLGSSITALKAAVDGLNAYGGTGIAAALDAAKAELNSVRAISGRRQVCILFTDGYANISDAGQAFVDFPNNPSGDVQTPGMAAAAASAASLIADGIILVVIGLDLSFDPTNEALVQLWASPGFYQSVTNADNLLPTFVKVLKDLCGATGGSTGTCEPVYFNQYVSSGGVDWTVGVPRTIKLAIEVTVLETPLDPTFFGWIGLGGVKGSWADGAGYPTFTIVSGTLPPGLTFNGVDSITGTPTTAGSYGPIFVRISNPCTVEVAPDNTSGSNTQGSFYITVDP